MNRRIWILSALALAVMAGTAGFLEYHRTHQRLGAPGVRLVAEPSLDEHGRPVTTHSIPLPAVLLGGTSSVPPITQAELEWLPRDTTFGRRHYQWPDKPAVLVSAVLMGGDRTSIHRPEYCLNGQGWAYGAADTEIIRVPMQKPVSYELPVMKVVATKTVRGNGPDGARRGLYLYWFVTDRELSARHTGRMWSQTWHMLRTGELQRWAYISYFAVCAPGQEETTLAWLKEVIAASVPEFQVAPQRPGAGVAGGRMGRGGGLDFQAADAANKLSER